MIHDFFQAHSSEKAIVLGFKLKPLSLGHLLLLHRVQSAFVIASEIINLSQLATAVLICSQSYSEAKAAIEDPRLNEFMERWAKRFDGSESLLVRLGLKNPRLINYLAELDAFSEYLKRHFKTPSYSYSPSDFQKNDCPEVQIVKVVLMRELHFSEAELMDRPWRICIWDYLTIRAIDGVIKVHDPDELDDARKVANAALEAIRKRGVACPS